jgi:hypothetical protein
MLLFRRAVVILRGHGVVGKALVKDPTPDEKAAKRQTTLWINCDGRWHSRFLGWRRIG